APLARVLLDWHGERIDLQALTAAAIAELAADVVGAPPGPRLQDALAGAHGVPLLALAQVEALQAASALATDNGLVELEGPADIHASAAVAAQLGEVDADTLRVLQVAAVLGRTLTLAD